MTPEQDEALERSGEAPEPPRRRPVQRVLIVEDCPDLGELLGTMLREAGYEVLQAGDGEEGLEVALRERPDAVLSDLGLPGIGGEELADRLRADLPQALLVAVSGCARNADRDRAERAGFDAYMVKPVDMSALLRVLDSQHA